MKANRVTQKDIATAANVHPATVSLALKNDRSIPPSTRERIHDIARKMGYVPDPMLSALAKYRMQGNNRAYRGVLAWVVNTSSPDYDWKNSQHYYNWYLGAQSQAVRHGFELQVVEYSTLKMKADRMASILKARNIQGVLLCPQPTPYAHLEFPWSDFSAVTFGYTLVAPRLHAVSTAHYQSIRLAFDVLHERGYKRIGLALSELTDERCGGTLLSAYLGKCHKLSAGDMIPPFYGDIGWMSNPQLLKDWYEEHRPDAIISTHQILDSLEEVGIRAPEDIGVAAASLPDTDSRLSGVLESSVQIGKVAIDFLVDMVYRGECGIPKHPQIIAVEGIWHEGKTLRPPEAKTKATAKGKAKAAAAS